VFYRESIDIHPLTTTFDAIVFSRPFLILTALIKILFEMLRQFLGLLFGEKGFSTGVVTLEE
jgi:hypothetical protein